MEAGEDRSAAASVAFLLHDVVLPEGVDGAQAYTATWGDLLIPSHPVSGGPLEYAFIFNMMFDNSDTVRAALMGLRASVCGGLLVAGPMCADGASACAAELRRPGGPAWKVLVPRLPEYGSAHSKLALLFYGASSGFGECGGGFVAPCPSLNACYLHAHRAAVSTRPLICQPLGVKPPRLDAVSLPPELPSQGRCISGSQVWASEGSQHAGRSAMRARCLVPTLSAACPHSP